MALYLMNDRAVALFWIALQDPVYAIVECFQCIGQDLQLATASMAIVRDADDLKLVSRVKVRNGTVNQVGFLLCEIRSC